MKTKLLLSLLFFPLFVFHALGQEKPAIPLAKIWASGDLWPKSVYGVNWMNSGPYYSTLEDNVVLKYDISKGKVVDTLLDGSAFDLEIDDYSLSATEKKILIQTNFSSVYRRSYVADYYVADLAGGQPEAIDELGGQSYASLSPAEDKVAFVRDNNLYFKDLSKGKLVQVTQDGKKNHLINGSTDWVYEEEFSITKAFFWSPDGNKLAYLKFDESEVPEYNMQRWGGLYPEDYTFKYPKAGEKNSTVRVFVYDLASNKHTEIEVGADPEQYIPRIQWTKDPNLLSVRRMNRLQNKMEILHANVKSNKVQVVYSEVSDTYIDIYDDLVYLKDRFLLSSDKDGYRHFYLYQMDGKLLRQITKGDWMVTDFNGLDEGKEVLYYTSTEKSPLERNPYAISLKGKNKRQLAGQKGTHRIDLSKSFDYFLDYYSTANQAEKVALKSTKKDKDLLTLVDNEQIGEQLSNYHTSQVEFGQLTTDKNVELNYFMIKPKDFDPNKQYPVLMFVYGGPGSQEVLNGWMGHNYYWFQHLAAKGYLVACVDNRGTGGRGAQFQKTTYARLGELELEDQVGAAKYFQSLDYTDDARIGIWGWSFGGYMTTLCLTKGGGLFKMGIAVAPVTNWRFYDTIYTERYLKTPGENKEGYDNNSPLFFADGLEGKLLLVHGTGDDNVHVQNAIAFNDALISANKQFDFFLYPNRNHGIYGGITRYHLYDMMTRFVEENL